MGEGRGTVRGNANDWKERKKEEHETETKMRQKGEKVSSPEGVYERGVGTWRKSLAILHLEEIQRGGQCEERRHCGGKE